VILMIPLDRVEFGGLRLGAVGLALGASVGAWLENSLLHRHLRAAIGPHRPTSALWLRVVGAGLIAAVAGIVAKAAMGSAVPLRIGLIARLIGPESPLLWPLVMAGTALAFGVTYLTVASALGVGVPLSRLRR